MLSLFRRRGTHQEHRREGAAHHLFDDAAEDHAFQPGATAGGHRNQVDAIPDDMIESLLQWWCALGFGDASEVDKPVNCRDHDGASEEIAECDRHEIVHDEAAPRQIR